MDGTAFNFNRSFVYFYLISHMYVLQTQEDVDVGQQPYHVNNAIHLDLNAECLGVSSWCQSL